MEDEELPKAKEADEKDARPDWDGFRTELHVAYFLGALQSLSSPYESQDCNRMTLAYFCVAALDILGALDEVDRDQVLGWVYSCQVVSGTGGSHSSTSKDLVGGFRGSAWLGLPHHPTGVPLSGPYDGPHIAMTYTALAILTVLGDAEADHLSVQCCAEVDKLKLDRDAILCTLKHLQLPSGSFRAVATEEAEEDVRFVYCAAAICSMLGSADGIDVSRSVRFLQQCKTYDNAYGLLPGLEAHGGATYCAVAALNLFHSLLLPCAQPTSTAEAGTEAGNRAAAEEQRVDPAWKATSKPSQPKTGASCTQPAGVPAETEADSGAAAEEQRRGPALKSAPKHAEALIRAEATLLVRGDPQLLLPLPCTAPGSHTSCADWLGQPPAPLLGWAVQRQCTDGGFQGRRNKDPDTCYGFWIGAVFAMLGVEKLVQHVELSRFLLQCQHRKLGGFSKHPGGVPDILHSFYGVCAFSLMGCPSLQRLYAPLAISARAAGRTPIH